MSQAVSEAVSAFYERFPYPAVSELEEPLPRGFATAALRHRLARPAEHTLPDELDIWIAGCGTRQAAQVALQHPKARIYATDISGTSLERSRALLAALGIDNVELAHLDLMEASFEGRFDLVYCTGVLHHTADPLDGARRIRRSLRPRGAALLMVYNEIHRRPFVIFQRVIELLARAPDDNEERLSLARQALADILARDVCIPLRNDLAGYDQLAERDFENFVDALIHPREVSYDIDSLHTLVSDAGLHFVDWLYPPFWDPDVFFRDEGLRARARELPPRARDKLVFYAGGYSCPYFDVIVQRDDAPPPAPLDDARLLSLRPLLAGGKNVYRVEQDRVLKPRRKRAYRLDGQRVVVELAREGYIHPKRWALPREVVPLLQACDGETSIEDLLLRFGDEFERDDMLALFRELLPGGMNLLAPV